MKKGIIYKATNVINGKIYIGQTKQCLQKRKTGHIYLANNKKVDTYFYRAIRKYGSSKFKWEIVWEGDINILNEKEVYYIDLLKSDTKGYNLNKGGIGNGINNKRLTPIRDGSRNPNYNSTFYTFYHKDGVVEKNITQFDMSKKYNLNLSNMINKKAKSRGGWYLDKSLIGSRPKPQKNAKKYTFYHKDGEIERSLTVRELSEKYNLNEQSVYRILCSSTRGKSIKSWTIDKIFFNKELSKHTFYHKDGRIEENITQVAMIKKYNTRHISDIVLGKRKYCLGWFLKVYLL